MTEGLRARQGSTIREVGGLYKVRLPFLSIFHYPTKSLPPLANMPFETDMFGTQADLAPLFGSRFDTRGVFSTSPDPPSRRKVRRGGLFTTTTPLARVSTQGECYRPPQTLPHIETRDRGGVLQHHHPFGLRFDAMGGGLTSPNSPLHQNARWEACSPKVCLLIN